jgi:hypothetical protein
MVGLRKSFCRPARERTPRQTQRLNDFVLKIGLILSARRDSLNSLNGRVFVRFDDR